MPSNSPTNKPDTPLPDGTLFVVATPIGNLDDITLRALKTLAAVDLIAAEDTRHTVRLLDRHGIPAGRLISCHEHNEQERVAQLLAMLRDGKTVALVSDAGTPGVSDPGFRLVQAARAEGLAVVPIPGPSAAVTALSAAGLPTDAFLFVGFAPRKQGALKRDLAALAAQRATLIFYESPRRLLTLLQALLDALGDRQAVLARELTKIHEEFLCGSLSEISQTLAQRPALKGECTLLVSGAGAEAAAPAIEQIRAEIEAGLGEPNAGIAALSQAIAKKYGLPRRSVYAEAVKIQQRSRRCQGAGKREG
ncbi:MAG: 16S rRNA (cytidine(1402)-2'-O)-methyltransferase [Desulfobacterales bacterium]|nr:16S rRNA (cytidine(1402)-2'-O)-methyltransferase [Desulfobacterales bacterium]